MSEQERRRTPRHSPCVPLPSAMVVSVRLCGFQTVQLIHDRSLPRATWRNPKTRIGRSQEPRKQLNRLGAQTAKLTRQGNTRAKRIVAQFTDKGSV